MIITINIRNEIKNSTTPDKTAATGIINRGKYIFDIKLALEISELLLSDRVLAKNCHGNRAVKVKIGYGIPLDGNLAILPKIIEKTTMVNIGLITAQAMPITVCL
jgi:hypothetical protein